MRRCAQPSVKDSRLVRLPLPFVLKRGGKIGRSVVSQFADRWRTTWNPIGLMVAKADYCRENPKIARKTFNGRTKLQFGKWNNFLNLFNLLYEPSDIISEQKAELDGFVSLCYFNRYVTRKSKA